MSIRAGRLEDLDQIVAIYNEAVLDGVSTCDLSEIPPDSRRGWLLDRAPEHPLYVAELDGGVVGWTALGPFESKRCFARTAYTSTYVARQSRRSGVGRALRIHLIREARSLGLHVLVNRIFFQNRESIRLTENLGFVLVGTLREVGHRDGRPFDVALYQLTLNPEE